MKKNEQGLFAGFGKCDITPEPGFPSGMWMAQKHARCTGVHRRFYVYCLIVGEGDEAVAIVTYDLCILSARQIEAIKAAVGSKTGLSRERIWLHVSHTHAGPVTQDFYDREGADEVQAYVKALPERSAKAAEEAWRNRRSARAASAKGRCDIGVNRDLNYHGRIVTGPNPGGFADPEVGVIRLDGADGRAIAAVVTYGCHPTFLGPDNKLVSPDYPGVTRDVFEKLTGAPCVFIQAGAGNVGPYKGFLGGTEEVERCGTILACEATRVFLGIATTKMKGGVGHVIESGAPLGVVRESPAETGPQHFRAIARTVALPTDNPGPTVYDTVEQDYEKASLLVERLRREKAPAGEIEHAIQQATRHRLRTDRKHLYLDHPTFPLDVGAIRMGEMCVVSVGCEAYAEIGVEIRKRSPFPQTVFVAYEGPDVCYVAPPVYYQAPLPMEISNSPFGPRAAAILIDAAVGILGELAANK